jgi:hypothetical protein
MDWAIFKKNTLDRLFQAFWNIIIKKSCSSTKIGIDRVNEKAKSAMLKIKKDTISSIKIWISKKDET